MKNLKSFGVQALSAKEMKEVDGGIFGILIAAIIIIAVRIFVNDGNDNNRTYINVERVGN